MRQGETGAAVLAIVLLAGCGGSPAAVAHPTAIVAIRPAVHRAPVPNKATQQGMGQVLAVQSLAHDAVAALSDAAMAQSEQLPDTAAADFTDAANRISGAERLLAHLTAPFQLNDAVLNLRTAVNSLGIAAANHSAQGPEDNAGQQSLGRADSDIRRLVNGSLGGVAHARDRALLVAALLPHPQRVAHRIHPRAHRVLATATALPTATPQPTVHIVSAVHSSHRRLQPHRARTRRAVHRVHPRVLRHLKPVHTPTAVPTYTAVPTSTPKPQPTAVPASVAALAPYLVQVRAAHAQTERAWNEVTRCVGYVNDIRSGTDMGGSARIHHCLSAASLALDRTTQLLTPVARHAGDISVSQTLTAGLQSIPLAQRDLRAAGMSVDALSPGAAQARLTSVESRLARLRQVLFTAASGRPL